MITGSPAPALPTQLPGSAISTVPITGAPAAAGDRCLVLWFPGWPVTAWALAGGADAARPVAVVAANRVVACSPEAAAEGVVIGQRRREAHSRCPGLEVLGADEARDSREFAQVVECVEQLAPGVQVVRPGVCALRSRGLASYVGSEAEAAEVLLEAVVVGVGVTSGRVGIADGMFTALQAAYLGDPVNIVAAGQAAGFLAMLPVSRLGDEALSSLLPRLGVHTLGDFAALAPGAVRDRFGQHGLRLHTLASGRDPSRVQPRVPPPELTRQLDFEPPLALVEQVAFTARATVEEFIAGLTAVGLACTELRVEVTGELDELVARTWLTPGVFEPAAVIDRIRWQLQAAAGSRLNSGVTSLRLEPVAVDALANHVPGLFGSGTDERVHHVLSRVQGMLGHEGVLTPRIGGGRWLAERQLLVPWGDRPVQGVPAERPWPGRVPDPLPTAVFSEPRPLEVITTAGECVKLDERGQLLGQPAELRIGDDRRQVVGWAGPWPIEERAWDPARHRRGSRFQVIDDTGSAWLLVLQGGRWWAEGRYE